MYTFYMFSALRDFKKYKIIFEDDFKMYMIRKNVTTLYCHIKKYSFSNFMEVKYIDSTINHLSPRIK